MPRHIFPEETYSKFTAVHNWITSTLLPRDPDLDACLAANTAAGLDNIDVAPNEGMFLYLLAKMNCSTRVLEIGTLGGYSAIWFAKAVGPVGGKVITLELDPSSAAVAASNISRAGFSDVVEIRVGHALETLEKMVEDGETEKFDMVFVDADKDNSPKYLEYAMRLAKKGTVMVFDNVVRQGRVLGGEEMGMEERGTRELFEMLGREKRLECTAIQTVGPKSWDGFAIARVAE